jgi:hypothetical protein
MAGVHFKTEGRDSLEEFSDVVNVEYHVSPAD